MPDQDEEGLPELEKFLNKLYDEGILSPSMPFEQVERIAKAHIAQLEAEQEKARQHIAGLTVLNDAVFETMVARGNPDLRVGEALEIIRSRKAE